MKSVFSLKLNILKIFVVFAVLFSTFVFASQVEAATLSLSPSSASVTTGDTFTVSIILNTSGVAADGVDIKYLNFDPSLLEVSQVLPGALFPSTQVNIYDNTAGTINFSQVTTGGSTFTGSGTLATVTFLTKSAGTATLTFDFVLNNTTDTNVASGGTDVLTNATGASYTISAPTITPTICTSFTYSSWTPSTCPSNQTQTRTITSSSPSGCTGGTPSLSQSCAYVDTTPPIISNINVTNITAKSATITWSTDKASNSQVEYGLSTAYSSGATNLNQTMTTSHSETLSNLSSNTTYHFRIQSATALSEPRPSLDQIFKTTGLPDTTAPSSITDITTSFINHTSVTLNWTSIGDDGAVGTAASYDIRYSTSDITEDTWSSAVTLTGEPTPKVSGSSQKYTVAGLSPSTKYYFAIKSKDEAGNTSSLSSIASAITNDVTPNPILGCTDSSANNYSQNATEDDGTCTYPSPPPSGGSSSGGGGSTGGGGSSSGGGGSTGGGGSYFDSIAPGQPSNFSAQGADKQVSLSWNNPKDNDFVRVILFRSTQEIPDNIVISSIQSRAEIVYEGTEEEYSDTGLDNNTEYNYAIYAHDKRPNYSRPVIIKAKPEAGKTTITKASAQQTQVVQGQASGQTTGQASYITSNLYKGQDNDQTKLLQQLLATDSTIYPEAITSGYYGSLTQSAVERFQCKHMDICSGTPQINGYGTVGPRTREKLNEVFVSQSSDATGQAQTTPQAVSTTQTTQVTTTIPSSGLSQSQINSIVTLLESFGADQDVLDNVKLSLQGGTISYQSSSPVGESDGTGQVQTTTTTTITGKITGPFGIDMTSTQVTFLQQTLAKDTAIYPEAITSGYYGSLTQSAVERFQCKYMSICSGTPSTNGYGLAGPNTRAKINEVFETQ